ncbi:uncharacterized protein LOC111643533 [Copidosoma floridanum]|uniref:uncharacterized protein LOC111643533 n=1 Tax=Copidosoma floridanum TaxID=29053 RepID=UPI000C6F71EE|nr:uncharacterized protein LOC111643533 [Copidosoma floridanum]
MEEENKKKQYLHVAVCTGDVDQVRDILESDSSCVNDYNRYFQTSLNLVCNSSYHPDNKFRIMQLLIDYGADVNIRGIHEESPLTLAIEQNHINGIKLLIQSGADPTWALIKMVNQLEKTSFNVIRILIEHMNLDSNIIEYKYGTLLDKAISLKDFDLMQMLVDLGIKSTDIYHRLSCLCTAKSSTSVLLQRLIEYLLSHATKVDSHGHFTLKALKCYMVTYYHHDKRHWNTCSLKKYLLERGIDDDDDLGDSDLHRAVRNEDKELVQSLLAKGSNVNARNNFGDTPLHLLFAVYEPTREEFYYDFTKLLIEYGKLYKHYDLNRT